MAFFGNQQLVPLSGSRTGVCANCSKLVLSYGPGPAAACQHCNHSVVLYGPSQPPVLAAGGGGYQQQVGSYGPTPQRLAAELVAAAPSQPISFVYNDGPVTYSAGFKPASHQFIYNSPNSHVSFVPAPGSAAAASTSVVAAQQVWRCPKCARPCGSEADVARHRSAYPRYCAQHNECHGSWTAHVNKVPHLTCPLPGCSKEFESDRRFKRHFVERH